MKFNKMLSCFVAFVLICCNLVVSTCSAKLPSSYPVFKFDLELDASVSPYPWAYLLMYNQRDNNYKLYIVFNDYEFYNETYLTCYYYKSGPSFLISRSEQSHLSNIKIYDINFKTKDSSSIPPIYYDCNIYSQNKNSIPFLSDYDQENYPCTNSGYYEIVACNRDIVFCDNSGVSLSGANFVTIFKGDENYLNSFFADGYKPVYPSFEYQLVTQPSTEPASSSSSGDNTEQVKTSKNILENVKNLLKFVGNLPDKIFDSFSSAFSSIGQHFIDLPSRIFGSFSSVLTDIFSVIGLVKDAILLLPDTIKNAFSDLLKTLFVPSNNNSLTEIKEILETKFGFYSQFVNLGKTLVNSTFGETPKAFTFTLYGHEWKIIDWSYFAPYRVYIRTITIIVNYYWFVQRTIKKLPGVIGGITSDK